MHIPRATFAVLTFALAACGGGSDSAQADGSIPCEGGVGGGFRLTDHADATYAARFTGGTTGNDSLHIDAVFIGRGTAGWRERAARYVVQAPADSAGGGNGGTLGAIRVVHDPQANVAMIQDQRVTLDSGNVVLLDGVETAATPPVVVRTLRVPPVMALQPGTCGSRASAPGMQWTDSLRAVLLRTPEIREFAAGR